MRYQVLILTVIIMPVLAAEKDNLESYFLFMGFELEETELAGIQEVLGAVPTHHEGDAAYSYTAICYRVSRDNVTVYFESGEMV